jgi:hypothetical protein
MEPILGIVSGIALLLAVFLIALSRTRSRRFQYPPSSGWGYPGRSGDREPRHPMVPAGSAAATVEDPITGPP